MKKFLYLYILIVMIFAESSYAFKLIPLTPGVTELLVELGEENNIIAVTNNAVFPERMLKLKKIGPFFRPNIESIFMLNPDYVIGVKFQKKYLDEIEKFGIKTIVVGDDSVDEIIKSVIVISKELKIEKEGIRLSEKWKTCFNNIKTVSKNRPKVLIVVGHYKNGVIAAANSTFLSDILDLSGGINILKSNVEYPKLNLENIVSLKPDMIIDTSCKHNVSFYGEVKKYITYKLFTVNEKYITIPGPRIFLSIKKIYKLLNNKELNLEKCLK